MPKAFSYIRFSSLQQGQGSSTERQEALIADWLDRNPSYTLAVRKIDRGRSAFTGEHKKHGLGLILKLIEDGEAERGDVLLVEAIDRLSREEPIEALEQFLKIVRSGLAIITLEDGQAYNDASAGNSSIYVLLGKMQQAHAYSQSLSRRIKASMDSRRTKAKQGQGFGLHTARWIDAENREHREPYASIVKRAIELYLSGLGTRAVATAVRQEFNHVEEIKRLNASTIGKWFDNPALVGTWGGTKRNPTIVEDAYKPLIDLEQYLLLQETRRQRVQFKPSAQKNELSGLVKCAACGSSYHFRHQKPRPTKAAPAGSEALKNKPKIIYGNCSNYLKNNNCSNHASMPYEIIYELHKEAVQDYLHDLALDQITNRSKNKELKELEKQRSKCSGDYNFLWKQYESYGLDETEQMLENKAKELKVLGEKIKTIKSIIDPDNAGEEFINQNYKDLLSQAINEEIKRLIENPLTLRETLKAQGYRILAKEKTAQFSNVSYEKIKRSQLHGYYIVRRLEVDFLNNQPAEQITYLAIKRAETGFDSCLIASASSEYELNQKTSHLVEKHSIRPSQARG